LVINFFKNIFFEIFFKFFQIDQKYQIT
jgi:hypothetical protein